MDWQQTVDAAGIESANPVSRLRGMFTEHEVPAVTAVDEAKLAPALQKASEELHREPADGAIPVSYTHLTLPTKA